MELPFFFLFIYLPPQELVREQMRRACLDAGDRNDPEIVALDHLLPSLTYAEKDADIAKAEDKHCLALPPALWTGNSRSPFDLHLEKMKRKQRLHAGDRLGDPQLQRLDAVIGLTSVLQPKQILAHAHASMCARMHVCAFDQVPWQREGHRRHRE
jgi:hypothetical protein